MRYMSLNQSAPPNPVMPARLPMGGPRPPPAAMGGPVPRHPPPAAGWRNQAPGGTAPVNPAPPSTVPTFYTAAQDDSDDDTSSMMSSVRSRSLSLSLSLSLSYIVHFYLTFTIGSPVSLTLASISLYKHCTPCGLGNCRISPPRFLAECGRRPLNHSSFVVLYFVLFPFSGLHLVSVACHLSF